MNGAYLIRQPPQQPAVTVQLHSAGDASPLTALLLPHIFPICSVVAPCHRGASPPSVRRRTLTKGCLPPIYRARPFVGMPDRLLDSAWPPVMPPVTMRDHETDYNDLLRCVGGPAASDPRDSWADPFTCRTWRDGRAGSRIGRGRYCPGHGQGSDRRRPDPVVDSSVC